ncbi:Leucine-rich repeat and Leucine-rich repeat, typical subtype-containing protein [Strongyloides ratti]|uniref:Leucine-rich repeat and Leucine-rich repeat, typical subtype-containing protein n=1 Tax=Strongyloides ratti TaxID=34506 RepID=A0A090MZ24_STRRB|nr:Leucine-rich repeat and Leucine-rich repeat, typical subtype-containing protein [Strongyloides ratti]CEF68189.1 Leucine-rich repeat and Leucine-rich repeat, typical subtype-containing protein [Strongyloides ratti]
MNNYYIFLYFYFTIILSKIHGQSFLCPVKCTCDDEIGAVNCDSANLKTFPIQLNPSIKSLILSNNNIKKINSADLDVYSDLEYLDLSGCGLTEINFEKARPLKYLKHLKLSNNNLVNISDKSFRKLKQLKVLDLSNNTLQRLFPHSLQGLNKLTYLNLSHNSINFISSNVFNDLGELTTLDLSYNVITKFNPTLFTNFNLLTTLILQHNLISEITPNSFSLLYSLIALDVSQNLITTIHQNAFHGLEQLKLLNLSRNQLSSIPHEEWGKVNGLIELDLSYNPIQVITELAFNDLKNLRVLLLNNLKNLKIVKDYAFLRLSALLRLDLSGCSSLIRITPKAFHDLVMLKQIDLSDNSLSTLHPNLLNWDNLSVLNLGGNSWNCTCEFLELIHSLSNTLQLDNVYCVNPENRRNRQAVALQGQCSFMENDKIYWGIIVFLSILITLTLLTCLSLCLKTKCLRNEKEKRIISRSPDSQNSSRAPLYYGRNDVFEGMAYNEKNDTFYGKNFITINPSLSAVPTFGFTSTISQVPSNHHLDEEYYSQLILPANNYYCGTNGRQTYSPSDQNPYAALIDDRRPIITPPMIPAPPPRVSPGKASSHPRLVYDNSSSTVITNLSGTLSKYPKYPVSEL